MVPWHHILPRFYLKGFVEPNTPARHEPSLWLADLVTGKIQKRGPRNAAAKTNFYLVDTSVDRHLDENAAETRLAAQESQAAPLLRSFLGAPRSSGPFPPELGRFVALLAARTHWLRRMAEGSWGAHLLEDGDLLLRGGDKSVGIIDAATGAQRRVPLSEALGALRDGRAVATLLPNQRLQMMWEQARIFEVEHLPRMNWTVLEAASPSFITSDRPVAWNIPGSDYGATDSPGALRVDGAEITVSLSAKVALFGIKNGVPAADIHRDVVNERIAALAERFIIAPTSELLTRALELRQPHLAALDEVRARSQPGATPR